MHAPILYTERLASSVWTDGKRDYLKRKLQLFVSSADLPRRYVCVRRPRVRTSRSTSREMIQTGTGFSTGRDDDHAIALRDPKGNITREGPKREREREIESRGRRAPPKEEWSKARSGRKTRRIHFDGDDSRLISALVHRLLNSFSYGMGINKKNNSNEKRDEARRSQRQREERDTHVEAQRSSRRPPAH